MANTTTKVDISALLTGKDSQCRIEWAINQETGHGAWLDISERPMLQRLCDGGNDDYGPGTHWIMTR